MTPTPRPLAAVLLVLLLAAAARVAGAQQTVPADFADLPVVGGLDQPVAMDFLPDGRLLVVERASGRVRLVVNGALATPDPVLVVDSVRAVNGEQGLLGVAVDPSWPARPFVYLQYDYAGAPVIRISRYTAAGDLAFTGGGAFTLDPASRYSVMVDLPDAALIHNGGTLRFGPDGMLYSSLGDDGSGCAAQDLPTLVGKILRLRVADLPAGPGGPPPPALLTPADNPFAAHAHPRARLVYAYGLRNPFAFEVDPATGDLLVGDVGASAREEVDWLTAPGMNLGWPIREGTVSTGMSCVGVDTTIFTAPIHDYPRPSESSPVSVIGGPVYRRAGAGASRFPPEYEGDVFFTDFYRGWVRRLKRTGNQWAIAPPVAGQPDPGDWSRGNGLIANLRRGPDGALWYCQMFSGFFEPVTGQIRRIAYTGTVAAPPPEPPRTGLAPPFPSPASGAVGFDLTLAAPLRVSLTVLDAAGRRVAVPLDRVALPAGRNRLGWDGRGPDGARAAAGVYRVRASGPGFATERRFVLLR